MDKNGILAIDKWGTGMADSAYTGFSNISNCEIFEVPGIVKIANRTVQVSTPTLTGIPIAEVTDPLGNTYFLTSDAKVYKNNVLMTDFGAQGWDLCLYGDYIIASYTTGSPVAGELAIYGPISSGSAQWFKAWMTGLSGSYYLKLLPARDGNLYITNGATMAKVSSFIATAPTVTPTATFSTNVMQLPTNNAGVTQVEVGTYILVGTQALNGAFSQRTGGNIANLYLWDKSDTKPTTLAGSVNEAAIQAMISTNNRVYFVAGIRGNLYMTDTTSFIKIKRIPWNQNRTFGSTNSVYPNAMSMNIQGNILVGTSTGADAFPGSTSRQGVYEINISEKGYPTVFKQQISTGNIGQAQPLYIGLITAGTGITTIGWQDGSNYGLDTVDDRQYTNSVATIESPIYFIANRLKTHVFEQVEFLLGKPLIIGQEITLSYRKDLNADYTSWKNYTFANLGAVISHNDKASLNDIQIIQFKIQLTQPINTIVGSNLEFMKLTVW